MIEKTTSNPQPTPAEKPPIPQPPTDGFPVGEDISTPPPGSDQAEDDPDANAN